MPANGFSNQSLQKTPWVFGRGENGSSKRKPNGTTQGASFMLHITCDLCGKCLQQGEDLHYIVKIEAFAAHDPNEITEADLEEDHLEAIGQILRDMEDNPDECQLSDPNKKFRYDLCAHCHQDFVRDPLGKGSLQKLKFSKN
jgi:hypothetical protein